MFPSSTEKSGYTSLILRALEIKALDAWDELLDPFDLERVGCTTPTEPLIRSEFTIPFPLLESAIPVAFSWWSLSIWAVLWTGEVALVLISILNLAYDVRVKTAIDAMG